MRYEKQIKGLQKFINTPFFYSELEVYSIKMRDAIIDNCTDSGVWDDEANGVLWTIMDIRLMFSIGKDPRYCMVSTESIMGIYNKNYESSKRKNNSKG